ncbi:hypothetical protein [Pelomonas sp. Root1217]|uniref:hypothetical protein n=1 Tax=Pelomonas sp. Root1217 TaxID=1736430 RepID=UPI000A3E3C6D|nr:hypothetical protein [Pelomonas sp. Root1217]
MSLPALTFCRCALTLAAVVAVAPLAACRSEQQPLPSADAATAQAAPPPLPPPSSPASSPPSFPPASGPASAPASNPVR